MLAVALPSLVQIGVFVVVALVAALGGLYTFRQQYGAYYKQAYEEQKARAEGFETKYEAERDLKHHLAAELAAERAKRDLSEISAALTAVLETQARQTEILKQIAARLSLADAA